METSKELKEKFILFDKIRRLFVDYRISKALKELGFNEPCFAHYSIPIEYLDPAIITFDQEKIENFNESKDTISCPLFQQVEDWLEQFDMVISQDFTGYTLIWDKVKGNTFTSIIEEDCILKAIEIIKNRQNEKN